MAEEAFGEGSQLFMDCIEVEKVMRVQAIRQQEAAMQKSWAAQQSNMLDSQATLHCVLVASLLEALLPDDITVIQLKHKRA